MSKALGSRHFTEEYSSPFCAYFANTFIQARIDIYRHFDDYIISKRNDMIDVLLDLLNIHVPFLISTRRWDSRRNFSKLP